MASTALSPSSSALPDTPPAHWGAVLALSLAAFALVASEFLPVSLLTLISADLRITEGQAGQGIAVSGAFALLTSLLVAPLTTGWNRKTLLIGLTGLMVVSGTVVALAPSAGVFMAGRALIGVAIGGFWSMSAATAMRLVPEHQVPHALAVLNGGNALASVVAAPLGSLLGAMVGWRGAFFCVVPVALATVAWQALSLPALPTPARRRAANPLGLMRRAPVATGMVAVSLFFMGQFTLFTYLRPFLESVTQVGPATLSALLLGIGLAGLVGTSLIGRVLGRRLFRTLALIPALMATIALALIGLGPSLPATAVLLVLWGLVATAAPVAWWTWLARTLPDDAEAGGGLMVAIVQLAITLGATVGGVLYDHQGHHATFGAAAAVLVLASLLAAQAGRAPAPSPRSLH